MYVCKYVCMYVQHMFIFIMCFGTSPLHPQNQARWLDITKGVFELTEWHAIAKEWFGEKPRNSEQVDAPCMLRKGLPRAFPGLDELKDQSRKEGTQYRSRVFQAPPQLVQGYTDSH